MLGAIKAQRRSTASLVFSFFLFFLFCVRCMMTHVNGNLYPNVILQTRQAVPLVATLHYLPSGIRLKEIIRVSNSRFSFCPSSGEIMSNIFFIDLFINVENELLKGLCWSNPDAIKVIDAPSWAAAMAGGKIPGPGWGVNYIDWPPFPHQKPRWWPKALSWI